MDPNDVNTLSDEAERERLRTLKEYDVLDAPPAEAFDRITRLATRLFDVPIAMVNFIDSNQQWCVSAQGLSVQSTPRNVSFCTHTIQSDGVMVVEDAREDERFADNPFVTGEPGIRFYAGAPLKAKNGYRIGTLCLLDHEPHTFSDKNRQSLRDLANVVMDELNLRRYAYTLNESREAFRESNEHTTRILESITDAFFALNDEWEFTYVNAQAEEMLETPRQELLGTNIWESFSDAIGSAFYEEYHRAIDEQTTVEFSEYYPPLNRWFEVKAYLFQGGLSVYFRDVTERMEARKDLRRERDLVEAIVGTSVSAIVIVDAETGNLTFTNPKAEDILGVTDTIGNTVHQSEVGTLYDLDGTPITDEDWPFHEIVASGMQVTDERFALEPSRAEDRRIISVNGAPLEDRSGTVRQVVFSIIDITDQVRRERELKEAKEEAERASRLKSSFLANMSHDVRTPLSSIMSLTELLSLEAPDHLQERIQLIDRSSHRLLDTIDSVLDLSKIESGTVDLSPQSIDVADEMLGTIEIFRPQMNKDDVDLTADIPERPVKAVLDPSHLHRITDNLISNAIKFTPSGGRVNVALTYDADAIEITVSDTGIGIEDEFLPDLFEAFARGHNRTGQEGSGLGLAITKRLTEIMDGTIEVDSTVGEGTTFTVTLPREVAPQDVEAEALKMGK